MENFAVKLKAARKMAGLSMQQLVNATNKQLSQQAISRYERGIMTPTSENLLILTRALNVKPDFFLRNTSTNIDKIAFRKMKRLSKKEEDRIKYLTIDFLERLQELESILGETTKFENPLKGFQLNSIADVEHAAEEVREKWDLGKNPIHSAISTLEYHNVDIFPLDSDAAFSGMASEPSSSIKFMVVNTNSAIKIDRLRFTLMHELGHMIMEDIEFVSNDIKEKFANRFAGAIYIPKERIIKILGEKRKNISLHELMAIKKEYGLSIQAIAYRARDLEIISSYTHQSLMKMISSMGWRKQEPQPFLGEESPTRLFRMLNKAISEEVITTSKAATLLNVSLEELNARLMNFNFYETDPS